MVKDYDTFIKAKVSMHGVSTARQDLVDPALVTDRVLGTNPEVSEYLAVAQVMTTIERLDATRKEAGKPFLGTARAELGSIAIFGADEAAFTATYKGLVQALRK